MNLKYILILLSFLLTTGIKAQRPKIGLTLSGGGAKGLAHIGILQAIDSAGLKIDYITGTSAGGFIGAMYATGYSGNQIDSIIRNFNWGEMLSGKPKYKDVGIDEKDEFGKYSIEIPFDGLDAKMGTGLIESEENWLQFSDIFFHVYNQTDFSKFDIPFKCIATNLSSGEAVILDTGQIVKALRSTMAIPSVLTSVKYEDIQLVDGGIVRNFPVSDVKDMGADFTIGVNLFSGLANAEDLNSAVDVMYQITNYRDAEDLVKQKKLCNILIEPNVAKFSAGSFSEADEILDIGYKLKEVYYPIFKRLADSLNRIQKVDFNPNNRLKRDKNVIIDSYKFIGLNKLTEDILIRKSNLVLGNKYTALELNEAFRKMYSTLYFQYIYYELIPTTPGHADIIVRLKEQYPGMLKVTFNYHSFIAPAIILNYTWRNLVFDKSRSIVKFAISQDLKALLEQKQFFGRSLNNTITFKLKYLQQRLPFFDKDKESNLYKTGNFNANIGVHHYFARKLAFGGDFSYYRIGFSPDIASYLRFDGYDRGLRLNTSLEYSTINRPFLPTSGIDAKIQASANFYRRYAMKYSGSDTSFTDTTMIVDPEKILFKTDFYINYYKSVMPKLTLIINGQGGAFFAEKYGFLDNYFLGGNQKIYNNFAFSGYKDCQIPTYSFASGLIGIQYKVWSELYLLGKFNIGLYDFIIPESGFAKLSNDNIVSGFSATLAYNLSMLPVEFSINYSPEIGVVYSSVNIGFVF
jgi:NTE family protein